MSEERERRAAERRSLARRSRDKRQRGAAQLATLLEVTRKLMTVTDLDALLRLIAEATTQMAGAERATIYIVDAARNEYW